jgi:hypothetical protein
MKIINRAVFGGGLSELSQVFRQKGSFGFYMESDSNRTGFLAPGISANLAFYFNMSGGSSSAGFRALDDDLSDMRREMNDLKARLRDAEARLDVTGKHVSELDQDLTVFTSKGSAKAKADHKVVIDELLQVIQKLLENKDMADPEEISGYARKITAYRELAIPKLSDIIRNPKSEPRLASLCIQMIGQIGDKRSREILVRILDYRSANLKIDAIIALGKLRDRTVVEDLKRALNDTDEAVVLAAREVINSLGAEALPVPQKPSEPPPAPVDTAKAAQTEEPTPEPAPVKPPAAAATKPPLRTFSKIPAKKPQVQDTTTTPSSDTTTVPEAPPPVKTGRTPYDNL